MIDKDLIVNEVGRTIKQYDMLDSNYPVPVAFSGGKDSASTIFILEKLGYDVKPIIIDRGDDGLFNSSKIADNLRKKGYSVEILNLRDPTYLDKISPDAAADIQDYLKKFDNLEEGASYCTPCYNARTSALVDYTERLCSPAYVIGQHKTDMITSLMKCYWTEQYYNALTKPKGMPYEGYRMMEFIRETPIDLDYLEDMVLEERASTDDPPVEEIYNGIRLVRPLCAISESDIKEFVGAFPHDSDNCSYRQREPRPFRLLVQFDLYDRLKADPELEEWLYEYVIMGLDERGMLKFRPRNKRNELYPGFKPYIRKL
jgi:tRNA(Ile)-lysidine synthase TilS/MesJ